MASSRSRAIRAMARRIARAQPRSWSALDPSTIALMTLGSLELLNKRGRRIEVHVGAPISAPKLLAMPTPREQVDYLRWRTHLLA
jgi:hypothetical protein